MQQHMGQAMESWLEVVNAEMTNDSTLLLNALDMCTQAPLCTAGLQALFHTVHGWIQLCNACRSANISQGDNKVSIVPDSLQQA